MTTERALADKILELQELVIRGEINESFMLGILKITAERVVAADARRADLRERIWPINEAF